MITPIMPKWGKLIKHYCNAGKWGWISDKLGYKYVKFHPTTKKNGRKYLTSSEIWNQFSDYEKPPNCSLINVFPDQNAKLGLHQDKDEKCFKAPVLSISLGNTALFKYGIDKKNLKKVFLPSGSIVLLKDYSRLYYHSVQKIFVDKNILKNDNPDLPSKFVNGRISITLRKFSE